MRHVISLRGLGIDESHGRTPSTVDVIGPGCALVDDLILNEYEKVGPPIPPVT